MMTMQLGQRRIQSQKGSLAWKDHQEVECSGYP